MLLEIYKIRDLGGGDFNSLVLFHQIWKFQNV